MTGIVAAVNPIRAMVAVLMEDGSHTIFEMFRDDPPELGDMIHWANATALLVRNRTQGQNYDVCREDLRAQLLFD